MGKRAAVAPVEDLPTWREHMNAAARDYVQMVQERTTCVNEQAELAGLCRGDWHKKRVQYGGHALRPVRPINYASAAVTTALMARWKRGAQCAS